MLYSFSSDINNVIGNRILRSRKTKSIARFLPEGGKPYSVTELSPQHEHLVHVHLCTGNEETIVVLPYSDQTMQLMDLVPIAQTFCDAIVETRIKQSQSDGHPTVCKQCHRPVCCQHLFAVSTPEAAYLAEKLTTEHSHEALLLTVKCRNRAQQLDRMITQTDKDCHNSRLLGASNGLMTQLTACYNHLELDCIFLQNKRCVIYSDRPLSCRYWLATGSPVYCRTTGATNENRVDMPVNMNDVLIETTSRCLGARAEIVTLPTIIDWYERHNTEYKQAHPSGDLVGTFLESLKDTTQQKPKGHTTIRIEQIR